MDPIIITSIF